MTYQGLLSSKWLESLNDNAKVAIVLCGVPDPDPGGPKSYGFGSGTLVLWIQCRFVSEILGAAGVCSSVEYRA
jgi:hypothetical protein